MKEVFKKPPKWPLIILAWFCKPYYLENIEGDLLEIYEREAAQNEGRATRLFYWNVIRFFRLHYIKNIEDLRPKSSLGMLKNYFKVSIRSMKKNSGYASLNILGLSTGIAACLLLIMHITFQITFDKHIVDNERIYRLVNDHGNPEHYERYTPALLVQQMTLDFPEIQVGTRVKGPFSTSIKKGNLRITQNQVLGVDSTFFEVFPAKFIYGQGKSSLSQPNSLVLTQGAAERIFQNENPMGQIVVSDGETYTVTAVIENQPYSTTIPYQAIISLPNEEWVTNGNWTGNNFYSYVKLHDNVNTQELVEKFPSFTKTHLATEILNYKTEYETWEEYLADGNWLSYQLIPLLDIHLNHSNLSLNQPESKNNIYIYSIIALFILLIACVNYVNMSTAKSSLRYKEIGMRKVLGSVKNQLVQQFLLESMLTTFISVLIGLLIAFIALPYFNTLTDMQYTWVELLNGKMIAWVLVLTITVGIIAGSYPAIYLSRLSPISSLRKTPIRGKHSNVRGLLVIFQFTISIFLITATCIVFKQTNHAETRNLGMNTDKIIVVKNEGLLKGNYQAFVNELQASTFVDKIGSMSHYPSGDISDWQYQVKGEDAITINPDHIFSDEFALQTLGIELLSGSFFKGMITDSMHVIVNETFVKKAGWAEALGQKVSRGQGQDFKVIGVVRDFTLSNAQYNARPAIFRYSAGRDTQDMRDFIHIKTLGDYDKSIALIANTWEKYVAEEPLNAFFLDDSFNRLYDNQRRFGNVFISFSVLTILIALIGLFSLTAFTLEQKFKEIAIRKVMGASASKIMIQILLRFTKLICIGGVLAFIPIKFLGDEWLNGFDYRISIDSVMILIPFGVIIILSAGVIAFKSHKTANDNPVNALRAE